MLGLVHRCPESASMLRLGLDSSKIDQNRVKAKDAKSCTYCCYVRCGKFILRVGGNTFVPSRRNSLPCRVKTSKQGSCNQMVGCLLGSMARIYDIWDGSLDKRKVRGLVLVPCCDQDGYRAQVLQHLIDL